MNRQASPDLLTTHSYIMQATDVFGCLVSDEESHQIQTKTLDADEHIPVAHTLESRLIIPVQEDEETGEVRIKGDQTLELSVWGESREKRTWPSRGVTRSREDEESLEQPCLATVSFGFNTSHTWLVEASLFNDGQEAGLEPESALDETGNNLLVVKLARLVGEKSFKIPEAARAVYEVSLATGHSRRNQHEEFSIDRRAEVLQEETGRPIPPSLKDIPRITACREALLTPSPDDPSWINTTVTMDDYRRTGRESRRVITDYSMTEYNGFLPVDIIDAPLGFAQVYAPDRNPTGISFSIDVSQLMLGPDRTARIAESDAEVREMMSPFIRAITNYRRYRTAAAKVLLGA